MGLELRMACRQELRHELSLKQQLRLEQRMEQRLEMKQSLELALKVFLKPPTGMSFKEPDSMKEITRIKGKPVIEISKSEMDSYISAVRCVAKAVQITMPNVVLISMRGALPLFRAAMQYDNQYYLVSEHRCGVNWKNRMINPRMEIPLFGSADVSSGNYEDWRARLIRSARFFSGILPEVFNNEMLPDLGMPMRTIAVKAPTSYFLNNLSDGLEQGLHKAFSSATLGQYLNRKKIVLLFLDTSVTGTKLGWFTPQFMDVLKKVAQKTRKIIHLVAAIMHHDKDGMVSVGELQDKGCGLFFTGFDIGVESLITEDSPTLLGASYKEKDIRAEAIDEIRACERPRKASIMVDGRLYDIRDESTGSTAALFARIAGDEARKIG